MTLNWGWPEIFLSAQKAQWWIWTGAFPVLKAHRRTTFCAPFCLQMAQVGKPFILSQWSPSTDCGIGPSHQEVTRWQLLSKWKFLNSLQHCSLVSRRQYLYCFWHEQKNKKKTKWVFWRHPSPRVASFKLWACSQTLSHQKPQAADSVLTEMSSKFHEICYVGPLATFDFGNSIAKSRHDFQHCNLPRGYF